MRLRLAILGLSLLGCSAPAADHERLGDAAYSRADILTALEEYRAAVRASATARLYAKLGAAALRAGEPREAADAYRKLALDDPSRADEAATGLELIARAAERAGDAAALQSAVVGLREVAPGRLSGRYAIGLVQSGNLGAQEMIAMGPAALAAAGDASTMDSILVLYGEAFRQTTACEDAARAYQSALRRGGGGALHTRAAQGFAGCASQLGQEALTVEHPDVAARWFGRAVSYDSTSDAGRRALVGLGDARVAQGDILGAAIAYQDAIVQNGRDSVTVLAEQRLSALSGAANGADTTRLKTP
jgi:tetratricopeptide (TPR) repeat protein